jgi:hypothetical protein
MIASRAAAAMLPPQRAIKHDNGETTMKHEDMIPVLAARFTPDVLKTLDGYSHRVRLTNVRFVEVMPISNGVMFEMDVIFDSLLMNELIDVAGLLSEFAVVDTTNAPVVIDDYHFMIGDGDDDGAIRFENGKFTIWVRGWRHEPLEQARL